jgi:hypothetical protein
MPERRPAGVTLIAVIAFVSGAVGVIAGALLLLAGLMAPDALWLGVYQLILGVLTIAVGVGLLRGAQVARVLAAIVFVLNLISAIFILFFQQAQLWSGIVGGLLAVLGLVLLFTRSANEFFRR